MGVAGDADPIVTEGAVHSSLALPRFCFPLSQDFEDVGMAAEVLPYPDLDLRMSRLERGGEPMDARHQYAGH